jgi:hypothetical protein
MISWTARADEVALNHSSDRFVFPDWLGAEVTQDPKYSSPIRSQVVGDAAIERLHFFSARDLGRRAVLRSRYSEARIGPIFGYENASY